VNRGEEEERRKRGERGVEERRTSIAFPVQFSHHSEHAEMRVEQERRRRAGER
jgi:hypothetical protein